MDLGLMFIIRQTKNRSTTLLIILTTGSFNNGSAPKT